MKSLSNYIFEATPTAAIASAVSSSHRRGYSSYSARSSSNSSYLEVTLKEKPNIPLKLKAKIFVSSCVSQRNGMEFTVCLDKRRSAKKFLEQFAQLENLKVEKVVVYLDDSEFGSLIVPKIYRELCRCGKLGDTEYRVTLIDNINFKKVADVLINWL